MRHDRPSPARPATLAALAAVAGLALAALHALAQTANTDPPGDPKSAGTRALEAGARLLQGNAPPAQLDIYLDGFHPLKAHPRHQMEAHHFCRQVNEDFAQCALFDGNGKDARLNGIEYIISEKLFESLPADERQYWHPHNGEILSGQLVAPGIPAAAEKELMRRKMNSYGKTWHVWNTGPSGRGGDALPLGPPQLAWSFSRDGEIDPQLVASRDRSLGIETAEKRRDRAELRALARPQSGVDALKSAFPSTREIPGVTDKQRATSAR
jgi:hypothetical protein